MYGSDLNICQSPRISVFHVGCFIKITREPSFRMTLAASHSVKAKQAPRKVRTRNPT